MKAKIISLFWVFFLFAACANKHVVVIIPVQEEDTISFEKFDKIILGGWIIDSSIQSPDPKMKLIHFFTDEYTQIINQKIEFLEIEKEETEPLQKFKEKMADFPNSLLITGTFKTDIKTRSIIKDIKDQTNKKKKSFVKIEFWEMKMEVTMIDINSLNILSTNTFAASLKDADPQKMEFNFKSLFDNISEQFIQRSQKKVGIQERFLLKN